MNLRNSNFLRSDGCSEVIKGTWGEIWWKAEEYDIPETKGSVLRSEWPSVWNAVECKIRWELKNVCRIWQHGLFQHFDNNSSVEWLEDSQVRTGWRVTLYHHQEEMSCRNWQELCYKGGTKKCVAAWHFSSNFFFKIGLAKECFHTLWPASQWRKISIENWWYRNKVLEKVTGDGKQSAHGGVSPYTGKGHLSLRQETRRPWV